MNLALYAAASGMEGQQVNLNAIAHNIANVNTTGFKRSKVEFQDLFYQNGRVVGADAGGGNVVPTGIQIGSGTQVAATAKVFTQGQITQTNESLDLAIRGDGFLEIQKPDGTSAYTRDGSLKVGPDGRITTSNGYPVLGGFQPVPPGTSDIAIAPNGEVTMMTPNGVQNYRIQLVRFNNPAGLQGVGGNLFEETPASGVPEIGNPDEQGFGALLQGYLETSNVNVVEEMVNLILAQRAYEINSKSIQTSDEMLQRLSQLKR
ncbi:MAG: flagellar basal-body rod protein FlgG [Puniceicoccaceae bacterium]|nr:MAG: flagellar basal-body rod protein FlgG [Puniceicoccaceae bacterium]